MYIVVNLARHVSAMLATHRCALRVQIPEDLPTSAVALVVVPVLVLVQAELGVAQTLVQDLEPDLEQAPALEPVELAELVEPAEVLMVALVIRSLALARAELVVAAVEPVVEPAVEPAVVATVEPVAAMDLEVVMVVPVEERPPPLLQVKGFSQPLYPVWVTVLCSQQESMLSLLLAPLLFTRLFLLNQR